VSDRTGRVVTTSLADYVVAANRGRARYRRAVRGTTRFHDAYRNPGVGELAIVGMPAAIANTVYHATGMRIRSLPIAIEKMLGHESSSPRASSPRDTIAGRAGLRSIAP
jgi:xanthine dehydrogenase YagR molybdenum-binding subunit